MPTRANLYDGADFANNVPFDVEADLNPTLDDSFQPNAPIGSVIAWFKTFAQITTGTTDGTTANKLVNSSDTFSTDGVAVDMIVKNTTDNTYSYVTAVDSETQLTLADDIFVSGETYEIYATPRLSERWVECNGQTLSDAESAFDGVTIPDLNGSSGTEQFLRGGTESELTGGSETHNHQWMHDPGGETSPSRTYNSAGALTNFVSGPEDEFSSTQIAATTSSTAEAYIDDDFYTANTSTLPTYTSVVWVMRIK